MINDNLREDYVVNQVGLDAKKVVHILYVQLFCGR